MFGRYENITSWLENLLDLKTDMNLFQHDSISFKVHDVIVEVEEAVHWSIVRALNWWEVSYNDVSEGSHFYSDVWSFY